MTATSFTEVTSKGVRSRKGPLKASFVHAFDLLPQAQAGNHEAQETIIHTLAKPLGDFARHFAAEHYTVSYAQEVDEDSCHRACTDALLKIINRPYARAAESADAFQGYIFRAWTNACKDLARKAYVREHESLDGLPHAGRLRPVTHYHRARREDGSKDPLLEVQHHVPAILAAVQPYLSKPQFAAFQAYLTNPGMDQIDLADKLGKNRNTFFVQLHRARAAIKNNLPELERALRKIVETDELAHMLGERQSRYL